jgi:hypothetical protein
MARPLMVLLCVLLICGSELSSQAPAVTLTATVSGPGPAATVTLTATVGVNEGQEVVAVEFLRGDELLGTDSDPDGGYVWVWPTVAAGDYALRARAVLTQTVVTTSRVESAPAPVTVLAAPVWSLTASPTSIQAGQSAILTFTTATANVHNVYISGRRPGSVEGGSYTCGVDRCAGSMPVTPKESATYTLTSSNNLGVKYPALSVKVTVTAAPAPAPPPVTPPPPTPVPIPATDTLMTGPESMSYQGSFCLPRGNYNGIRYGYGGHALAFNREARTLFVAGHANDGQGNGQRIGEISIPELRDVRVVGQYGLACATNLQGLYEPTEGKYKPLASIDMWRLGGLLPWGDQLLINGAHWYDAYGSVDLKPSLFASGRDLKVLGDVSDPVLVGTKNGYTNGYLIPTPPRWREALGGPVLIGGGCLSIVGRLSYGPPLAAFDPASLSAGSQVPAIPLMYFPSTNPLSAWNTDYTNLWNGTTWICSGVFPEGSASVLFFGKQGLGDFCYGTSCYEGAGQSPNAPPYVTQVWAFPAGDLVAVRAGTKKPWEMRPHAIWELQLPFTGSKDVHGATYDPLEQKIYLTQPNGENPLVHVYRVVLQ